MKSLLFILVFFGLLVATRVVFGPALGWSRPRVPLYPNAANGTTEVGRLPNWPTARHTNFQTADTPEQVLMWYRNNLTWWNGWNGVEEISPGRVRFVTGEGNHHFLDIRTERTMDSLTSVELWFAWVGS